MQNILNDYIKGAELHTSGTLEGNSDKANEDYFLLKNTYDKLKSYNQLSELKTCLTNKNDGVRLWSATHLLPINNAASNVLEEISRKEGILSFNAEQVLKQWKEGKLST